MQRSGQTLTRAEIAEAIQREVGVSAITARDMTDGVLAHIGEALQRGENVKITGFGTFLLNDKNARVGRNPRSGEEHAVAARRVVTFRPSETLKSRVAPPASIAAADSGAGPRPR